MSQQRSVSKVPNPFQTTTLLGIPILQKHSPNVMVTHLLNHNSHTNYTGILSIGHSGSGKTTCVTMMMHMLHERQNFAIHNYDVTALLNVDDIIKQMPKVPSILHFDDASYAFANMRDSEINKLASGLTTIRHEVKNNVIVFLNIHYSKAIEKFFRDVDYKILTSISDEEMDNYMKLFGYKNRYKLYLFFKRYRTMFQEHYFQVRHQNGAYNYNTDNPFRIALTSEMGQLHSIVYYRLACASCSREFDESLPSMTANEFLQEMYSKYDKNQVRMALRWYLYFNRNRPKAIKSKIRSVFNGINDLSHRYHLDSKELEAVLADDIKNARAYAHFKASQTIKERAKYPFSINENNNDNMASDNSNAVP